MADRILSHWSFLLYCQEDFRFLDSGLAAGLLSRAMGDSYYETKTHLELALMLRSMGGVLSHKILDRLSFRVASLDTEARGDLPLWLEQLSPISRKGDPAPILELPISLKFLTRGRPSVPYSSLKPSLERYEELLSESQSEQWILDAMHSWLVDLRKKTHRSFGEQSPSLKLVEVLSSEPGCLSMDEAFEKSWSVRYDEARHANTLSVAISRINAKKPSYAISRRKGRIQIECDGFVF